MATHEIVLRPEIRPAVYTYKCNDRDSWCEMKVLVHTTKTGMHGGYIVEDDEGVLDEVVVDKFYHVIRFVDGLYAQYSFREVE